MDDFENGLIGKHSLVREFQTREALLGAISRGLARIWIVTSNGTEPSGFAGPFIYRKTVRDPALGTITLHTQTLDGEERNFEVHEFEKYAAQCIASTWERASDYHERARAAYDTDLGWRTHRRDELLAEMISARDDTLLDKRYD